MPHSDPDQYGLRACTASTALATVGCSSPRRPREWEALAATLGHSEWIADPRFADAGARRDHDDALAALIAEALTTRDATEWEKVLTDANVGCSAVFPLGHSAFTCSIR